MRGQSSSRRKWDRGSTVQGVEGQGGASRKCQDGCTSPGMYRVIFVAGDSQIPFFFVYFFELEMALFRIRGMVSSPLHEKYNELLHCLLTSIRKIEAERPDCNYHQILPAVEI